MTTTRSSSSVSAASPLRRTRRSSFSLPGWARRSALLTVVGALVFALSGCLQLNAELSVRKNDTVSGRILLAGANAEEASQLNSLSVPNGLDQKVRISNYAADGFSGKEVYFTELTFADVDNLVLGLQADNSRPYTMSFRRSGSKVVFEGSVDLTDVPAERANGVQTRIDLSFPARVEASNGEVSADGTRVSWTPKPGTVTQMSAATSYPDPATRGFAVWLIVGVGAALLVCIAVVLAARSARARHDAAHG